MTKTLYPGSFDPITNGHINIIEQALTIYDKVIVAIMINANKKEGLFSFEERKRLIEQVFNNDPRVEVIAVTEKVSAVSIAIKQGCNTQIRGLRDITDFANEKHLAELNHVISHGKVKTIALFADPKNTTISSSTVKELCILKEDISEFVHPVVEKAIKEKLGEKHI